ncbi:restriction endonuclease subunit S [Dehalobacter restrictus]|uniref:restriction endonuclease subunit S n=1 Tax=Dehalobacter restrictus TaxID=55583 RepID=UPI0033900B5E
MKLDEMVNVFSGQIISRVEAKEDVGDTVIEERQVLIPKAIYSGRVTHADLGSVKLKKAVDAERITQKNDIVLKLSTPYDAAYITKDDEGLVVPSFCCVLRVIKAGIDPEFLTAFLNAEYSREKLKAKVAGSTMPMIKISDVKDFDMPDVPLSVQKNLGEAYSLSCQKQDVLRELLSNEQKLIESVLMNAVKEAITHG